MKHLHALFILIGGVVALSPAILFALPTGSGSVTISSLTFKIIGIINGLFPLIVGLALLFFFWGLAMFILNAGDESARAEARQIMIWGVIALFVIVSVWGLVNVLDATFGLEDTLPDLPKIPR